MCRNKLGGINVFCLLWLKSVVGNNKKNLHLLSKCNFSLFARLKFGTLKLQLMGQPYLCFCSSVQFKAVVPEVYMDHTVTLRLLMVSFH